MEINIMHHRTASRLLTMLFFAAMFVACSDNSDMPQPGGEEFLKQSAEEEMHFRLVRNFYKVSSAEDLKYRYEPSKGLVLDEAKPSERSVESESYELALQKFEKCLPATEIADKFINRDSNGITVSLDTLGSVKFFPASGDGVVAKAVISLKDAPEYTLLYRLPSSFGDNDLNFKEHYGPGDFVKYTCHDSKLNGHYELDYIGFNPVGTTDACYAEVTGVVIEVDEKSMSVLTSHYHQNTYKHPHFQDFVVPTNLPTPEEWGKFYDSWHKNRDAFIDTNNGVSKDYANNIYDTRVVHDLYDIMEGSDSKYSVGVYGDDMGYVVDSWNLCFWCGRIPVKNLRVRNLTHEYNYLQVGRTSWSVYYLSFQTVNNKNKPKLLYPLN